MRVIGVLLIFFFIIPGIHASPLPDAIEINGQEINLQVKEAKIAVGDNLTIDDLEGSIFTKTLLPFKTKSNVILKEIIRYEGENPIELIVEPAGFHYVDVYLNNISNGNSVHKKSGRLLGYPQNELFEINSASNKVKFVLEPNNDYELIVFYRNPQKEKININLSLADYDSWIYNYEKQKSPYIFWYGLFFGTLILLSLINFIFYYLFRDRTYMVYVAYILTILIYEALLYGFLDDFGLKYFPGLIGFLKNTTLILFIIFYLLFVRVFISLKENYPRWNKLINYLILFLVILMIASNIIILGGRPISGMNFRNIGLLLFIPVAITFLIYVVFSKRLLDRVFFTGSIILVISGLISIVYSLSDKSGLSDFYLQVGIIIELVIFNIGLGLRSKIIQNEKDHELHELILKLKESEEKQINLNANLENKVEERTEQINEINKELVVQRDQLFKQNETIEQNLDELNNVRKSLVHTVYQKTKELRQANKELVAQNAQLEQYAFITAHNLKAPVARLKGLVNIFELTNQPSDSNSELVKRIKEASLDMDDVISDINKILQIKNYNQQDRKAINLKLLIEKIENRLDNRINENNIDLRVNLEIGTIHSIDTYLESMLYNLIYNGIKYSRDNPNSYIQIHSYQKRNRVFIDVEDNGIGIDLDRFGKKIFGLYQRFHDHVNGKGIGLYLVKTQVEALQGKISIESEVNEGTTFSISFPLK